MSPPPHKISSKSTSRFKSCTHLKSLNVHHVGMVEAAALNSMESRSPSMSSPPYKISSESTNLFKSYYGVSLHPPQKFKRPPFCNGRSYGVGMCGIEVVLNGITFLPNFMKVQLIVSKVIGGKHSQTDRQSKRCPRSF